MLPVLTFHSFVIIAFTGLLVWAAASDLATMRISNRIPLAITALFFFHVLTDPSGPNLIGGLVTGVSIFLVGIVLFATRAMGGGDVKLMAAVGFWAGPELVIGFLIVTGLAGGLMALISCTPLRLIVAYAQTTLAPGFSPASGLKGQIPYGLAIAAGGFFVAAQSIQF
jgi:prepilin peptidase CpaA